MAARSGRSSAMPIQSTCGKRAAISPRMRPTRPAPMMPSPMRLRSMDGTVPPVLLSARSAGQLDRAVLGGRSIGRLVDLHHQTRLLGGDQRLAPEGDAFEEMKG